jgi:hypothetical protein
MGESLVAAAFPRKFNHLEDPEKALGSGDCRKLIR